MVYYLIFGIIAFLVGIIVKYFINRRRFYRRNVAGLQQFSSYESSVLNRFAESIGKLVAIVLIILGLCFIAGYFLMQQKADEVRTAPASMKKENR